MSVTYPNVVKVARMQAVLDLINTGGAGSIEIGTAGMAVILAQIPLDAAAGSVAGAGVLTFDTTPALTDPSANASGTAAAAVIKNGAGTTIISGLTVGTSGSDINLITTTIVATQPVTITSATLTHA